MYADLSSVYPMVTMRQYEFKRTNGVNNLMMTEKLVSEFFPIQDKNVQNGLDLDISQRIIMKEVDVTDKPVLMWGYYGDDNFTQFYETVYDTHGQRAVRHKESDKGYNIYHGKIVKHCHFKEIRTTAYSIIDMLSASGGLVSGMYYAAIPIASTFSRLSFELGVISLLYLAKSSQVYKSLQIFQNMFDK